jgi:hypothetical protein
MENEAYPFGVNSLSGHKLSINIDRARVVDQNMHIFEVVWADVLKQQHLPRYLRAATIALLANPGTTLVDMHRFLLDDNVRAAMLKNVTDPTVLDFWRTQYDELNYGDRMKRVQLLLGRLELLFMGRSLVRNIIGQSQTSINFRQTIEHKELVFIKLPTKSLTKDARLIGTMLMAQIHAAVFSFADLPTDERPGVSLYIDEFQNFVTPDIAELFTEGRKFGVKLTVAHQFRQQLPEYLRNATITARTKVCFQLTPKMDTRWRICSKPTMPKCGRSPSTHTRLSTCSPTALMTTMCVCSSTGSYDRSSPCARAAASKSVRSSAS